MIYIEFIDYPGLNNVMFAHDIQLCFEELESLRKQLFAYMYGINFELNKNCLGSGACQVRAARRRHRRRRPRRRGTDETFHAGRL